MTVVADLELTGTIGNRFRQFANVTPSSMDLGRL